MGKNRKKKRRKLNFTKTEFQQVFCNKCMLCPSKTEPVFCYGEVYKKNPKLFVRVIFNRLIEPNKWLFESGQDIVQDYDESIQKIFNHAFCASGFCGKKYKNGCDQLTGCLMAFRSQMQSGPKVHLDFSAPQGKATKKHTKKERYVAKPYPTFFCNEPFKTEIEALLNGNRNSKQNKVKEPPPLLEEHAGGASAGCEPEVPGSPGRW